MKSFKRLPIISLIGVFTLITLGACFIYPIDSYELTGIRRLLYLQKVKSGEITGTLPPKGAQKSLSEIKLSLVNPKGDSLSQLPEVDAALQKKINALFPGLDDSYAISVLDITEGKPIRYAKRKETTGFQPGSVGKLTVLVGLFDQLEKLYPDDSESKRKLLKNTMVKAGAWALPNEHTVPFYIPETNKFFKRTVQAGDVFSLYEWTDHMLSVSSNAAASVVWRELVLMDVFGKDYPVSEEKANEYFATTSKVELTKTGMRIVNQPLRNLGIPENEWKLGNFFTSGAKKLIPGSGGSIGTPKGLMKFLVAMERGEVIDKWSSLEMKRMMYITDRRIRYAGSASLVNAAVYYKSGSLYSCKPEEGFECKKYHGNVKNYMNSVAIVEHPDGTKYMVVLMSNVLRKNSSSDHYQLATSIDKILRAP